ncbi:MAG TPA: hypothetical protein VNB54_02700 [Alphaproteobacteria bacterium]|nr:hypothetical protein [Alphaproteobacteria bacterium]
MNRSSRNSPTLTILGLMVLLSISAGAQKSETIQAQAFGTTTQAGKTFGITIRIESYSTPADQKTLIDAFSKGGHDKLVDALSKMKGRGRVAITGGGVGYQIAYIRNIPTPTGRTIRIITDRPINIGEATFSTRSEDYDLTLMEIHINDADEDKSTGNLIVGGRFMVDKKKNQIEFESFQATPWRLTAIMER